MRLTSPLSSWRVPPAAQSRERAGGNGSAQTPFAVDILTLSTAVSTAPHRAASAFGKNPWRVDLQNFSGEAGIQAMAAQSQRSERRNQHVTNTQDPAYQAALEAIRALQEERHRLLDAEFLQPAPAVLPISVPAPAPPPPVSLAPPPPPPPPPVAPPPPSNLPSERAAEALRELGAEELAQLGRTDKRGFLEALRPAAEESERRYGVPAAVIMAQAALETGWGRHIIPGFNLFGIKGRGPAGTVRKGTWEVYDGKRVTINANFAQYHNFYEAVMSHGKLYHNGYYDRAVKGYAQDRDPHAFARRITGIYATDPRYGDKLSSIMREWGLA